MNTYPIFQAQLNWAGREPNAAGLEHDIFRVEMKPVGTIQALTTETALTKAKLRFFLPIIGQAQRETLQ